MRREYAHQVVLLLPLQCGQFDQEIEILYGRMDKVINVLFWGVLYKSFSRDKVHNMVAFMLDPCFKNMDCIMDYIGKDQATTLMQQYDDLIMMPLLKNVMGYLNLVQSISIDPLAPKQPSTSFGLFGSIAPTQEAAKGLF
jgi:hypothetical protein